MENEKDNFWLWIGGVIVLTVFLVFLLKQRENENSGWQNGAYAESKAEVEKQINKQHGK
jgi:hypothetical protein